MRSDGDNAAGLVRAAPVKALALRAPRCWALLCLALCASVAGAADADAADATDATATTDAAANAAAAWRWDAVYKLDALHANHPDITTAVDLFNLRLTWNAERLFGWRGTTLRAELLSDHGGKPNAHVGTVQGLSNLEVQQNSVRLYAAAIEHEFANGTGVLVGLYDLNSEFYATEASALLIHPAFGIGSEFAQTGANGPSIFPNLAFGLRVKADRADGYYTRVAALDAVPGDPAHPGRTVVQPSGKKGALLVSEFGWRQPGQENPIPNRWGIGIWDYSHEATRLDGAATGRNAGAYALIQAVLRQRVPGATVGFVRGGVANDRLNPIGLAFDAGVLVERPWGDAGPAALTAGIAFARIGDTQRRLMIARGAAAGTHEITVEVGARWTPLAGLALQPLTQHVFRVAGKAGTSATIVGMRIEWTLASKR